MINYKISPPLRRKGTYFSLQPVRMASAGRAGKVSKRAAASRYLLQIHTQSYRCNPSRINGNEQMNGSATLLRITQLKCFMKDSARIKCAFPSKSRNADPCNQQ
ncbi:hypothetical protein FGO68_gene7437 [Halteria grandinella]|uniref:Uncharacterized protein n=1 Tax=Halteria grandinella TaxID=5974 RepID=A0A8J8N9P2_HALGN|nr:hypothetical protein FGO68_gene7437 [Halteria grandinella]